MKKMFFVGLFVLISFGSFFAFSQVKAGPLTTGLSNLDKAVGPSTDTGLNGDLPSTIATIIKAILGLTGTIFFILTIYAGILWMTAMGNGEAIEKSRSIITAAAVGLAITLSAYAITYFVGSKLGGATNPQAAAGPSQPTKTCATDYKNGKCVVLSGGSTPGGTCVNAAYDTECQTQNAVCCYDN